MNNPCVRGRSLKNVIHYIIILIRGKTFGPRLATQQVFLCFPEISVQLLKGRKCQTAFRVLSKSSFG